MITISPLIEGLTNWILTIIEKKKVEQELQIIKINAKAQKINNPADKPIHQIGFVCTDSQIEVSDEDEDEEDEYEDD